MVKYSCKLCGKYFSQKTYYDSHNRYKTPCKNNTIEEKLSNKKLIIENKGININTNIKMTEKKLQKPFLK